MILPGVRWGRWEWRTRRWAWARPSCLPPEPPSRTSRSSSRSASRGASVPRSWPGDSWSPSSWAGTFAVELPSGFGSAGQAEVEVPTSTEQTWVLEPFQLVDVSGAKIRIDTWLVGRCTKWKPSLHYRTQHSNVTYRETGDKVTGSNTLSL